MLNFIDVVKEVMDEQGKSTEVLFSDGVISKDTFYKYRQRDPGLKTVLTIANYLKVSVDYLLKGITKMCFVALTSTMRRHFTKISCVILTARKFQADNFLRILVTHVTTLHVGKEV